ncbi:hypothetical protein [Glaciimonas sp. PAMC28666]|uniref:hypothetical protein n=1 Tax=Glaciimonas sp. PAMC28666 TaxID=2807626 RepID=UPI001962483D|nr:hypothetical protein [Glaciimonas sp. PAMC28666]QRX82922.1 hypothetical protein JQN73_01015 [Glaciimonas sp. PAMC28666]
MGVIKNKSDAAQLAVSCQQDETMKRVVGQGPRDNGFAEVKPASADDAASTKDREWERRKWIWQMGTIVFMGFSGLLLNAVIKPFATPRSASVIAADAYCRDDGQAYSAAQEPPANSLARVCATNQQMEQSARISPRE